jgi:Domain of unknown function (DUF1902)
MGPMAKPLIFRIAAAWDDEAAVWTGHCDDIPAAADAPTLDQLLAKISAMTLDVLADNFPGVDPSSVYLQITALREAEAVTA